MDSTKFNLLLFLALNLRSTLGDLPVLGYPAGRQTLTTPSKWPFAVESSISHSRTRLRIAASIAFLFRARFQGVLDTIAPLSRS